MKNIEFLTGEKKPEENILPDDDIYNRIPENGTVEENISKKEQATEPEKKKKSRWGMAAKAIRGLTAGAILFGATAVVKPEFAEAGVRGVRTVKKMENQADKEKVNIDDQIIVKSETISKKVDVLPEYERKMEKLMLTFPDENEEYLEKAFVSFLRQLPDYTEIDIVVNLKNLESAKKIIALAGIKNTINFRTSEVNGDDIEEWAQDYAEVIKLDGEEKFLLPAEIGTATSRLAKQGGDKRIRNRNKTMIDAFGKENAVVADFFFEGGNMTFDRTSNGLRVFIGYNDVDISSYNFGSQRIDMKQVAKTISEQLGGAEVIVMGNSNQEGNFVHIDQSFIVLDNKTIILNQFRKGSDPMVRYQHQYYKAQLEKAGYNVLTLDNDEEDLVKCRSSLNAIPFVDKRSGEKKIIFPVFENEIKNTFTGGDLKAEDLQGKAKQAWETFQKAGYIPIPIIDKVTHNKAGNIHCLTNVFAKNMEGKQSQTV